MDRSELLDRIQTLLMLYEFNKKPLPPAQTPLGHAARSNTEEGWAKGLLHNVTEMKPVPELDGTDGKALLESAIADAKTGNTSKLPEICNQLRRVQAILMTPPSS